MKWLIGALAALVLSADALAQNLPESVTEPYLAFEAAMRAGDAAAVLENARRAYEAGTAADIDLTTLATLAENYGYGAALHQDFETAQSAWREAARLSDRAGGSAVERAWRWHNAALFALQIEDRDDAYACARRAANALEELDGNLGAASDFAGVAFLTRAALAMGRGRIGDAGDAAIQSAEAFEAELEAPNVSYALALFYAGVAQTLDQEFERATYSLHVALDVMEDVAPEHPDLRTLQAATTSARLNLYDEDDADREAAAFARLDARLAANPFHSDRYLDREVEAAADDALADEADAETVCCDAAPIRRRNPDYPRDAAYSDIDGVVYVTFAVTEEGRTDAIEVTGSFPPEIFDEASIDAIEDWVYEPATRDGEPVRREGVETRFDFRMAR